MKKTLFALLALVGIMIFVSGNNSETYADKKKKERSAINQFIADSAVNVISNAANLFLAFNPFIISKLSLPVFLSNPKLR